MKAISFFTLFSLCIYLNTDAQVKTNFNNREPITERGKFSKSFREKNPQIIPAKDIQALLDKETRENTSDEAKPFKIAEAVPVDIDVVKEAEWIEENGVAYGKFTVVATDAKTISANFDKFYLPKGTELYVYSENGEMITGPITETENNENSFWGTWVYKGSKLTVDLKTPIEAKSVLQLHISSVAYGYKVLYVTDFGDSAPCNVNVLCAAGTGWENERNSVALILDGDGDALCSGALINNTCNLNIPYLLTANHCFDSDETNWRFTFQAWSATCTPSQNSNGVTFNGSTLRARNSASDFCLVELNQLPPANSGITFSGWNRNTNPATNTVGIHHPAGDVMKISVDANPPTAVAWFSGATNHWRAHFQQGTVQPGSSGSPLYDQNHRIVGQLHGDQNNQGNFCTQQIGEYGKFDVSWTGGGTNSTRLSNWLDPLNSGATTTNTINVANTVADPRGVTLTSNTSLICAGGSVTFTLNNLPTGTTVPWSVSPNVFTQSSGTLSAGVNALTLNVDANSSASSSVTITFTMNTGCGPVYFQQTVWVGIPFGYLNFTNSENEGGYFCSSSYGNYFEIVSGDPSSTYQARLLDITGQTVLYTSSGNYSANTPHLWTYYPSAGNGYYIFEIAGTNACGSTGWMGTEVEYVDCSWGYRAGEQFTVYPVPFANKLNVNLITQNDAQLSEQKENPWEISLVDFKSSKVIYQTTTSDKNHVINTEQVPSGQYVLIVKGKVTESLLVVKK